MTANKDRTSRNIGWLTIGLISVALLLVINSGYRFYKSHTFQSDCTLIQKAIEAGGAYQDHTGATWSDVSFGANGMVTATWSHPDFEASPAELLGDLGLDLGEIDIGGAKLDLNQLTGLDKIDEVTLGFQSITKNYHCPKVHPLDKSE